MLYVCVLGINIDQSCFSAGILGNVMNGPLIIGKFKTGDLHFTMIEKVIEPPITFELETQIG